MGKKLSSTMVEPMSFWMSRYDLDSKKQGWSLYDGDGIVMIMKIDEAEPGHKQLKDDTKAINLVTEQALKGNIMCLLALYLEGRDVKEAVDLPKLLDEKRIPYLPRVFIVKRDDKLFEVFGTYREETPEKLMKMDSNSELGDDWLWMIGHRKTLKAAMTLALVNNGSKTPETLGPKRVFIVCPTGANSGVDNRHDVCTTTQLGDIDDIYADGDEGQGYDVNYILDSMEDADREAKKLAKKLGQASIEIVR